MNNPELDKYVAGFDLKNDKQKIDQFINDYRPFVIKAISEIKNQYLSIENDEELSIGLLAFYEAIEKYKKEKGHFLVFAKLVIKSRLITFWESVSNRTNIFLEDIDPDKQPETIINPTDDLKEEILEFEKELALLGLSFEFLADHVPKHNDTRKQAVLIGRKASREKDLTDFLYEKRRLPITKIAEKFWVSVKTIKTSKYLIIAVMVIYLKNFLFLEEWIKKYEE